MTTPSTEYWTILKNGTQGPSLGIGTSPESAWCNASTLTKAGHRAVQINRETYRAINLGDEMATAKPGAQIAAKRP